MQNQLNPLMLAESLTQTWFPKVISQVDNHYVKVARLKGSFVWHQHQDQDELFLILKGTLVIEYENDKVVLNAGDLHVVPKGVLHNPVAENECLILIVEHIDTAHTGETKTSRSRPIEDQLT